MLDINKETRKLYTVLSRADLGSYGTHAVVTCTVPTIPKTLIMSNAWANHMYRAQIPSDDGVLCMRQ